MRRKFLFIGELKLWKGLPIPVFLRPSKIYEGGYIKDWTKMNLDILSHYRFVFISQGTEFQKSP